MNCYTVLVIKRHLTLKNKFLFKFIFTKGSVVNARYFNIIFVKKFPSYVEVGSTEPKLFGITASARFSPKSVVRNRIRRLILANVNENYDRFKPGYYVFVPKKNVLDTNGKIGVDVKEFNADFNKAVSKMALI